MQAMIRLSEVPGHYQGLEMEKCGLLFLSTPHSGSLMANWNEFMIELAKIGGVSRGWDFTELLSAFNQQSAAAKERFGLLEPIPPIKCLYETQYTSIKGVNSRVRSACSS
jgi:hypothetical protein